MIALAIVLLILGLGLILAEVFFPSLGLFGVSAALCILAADVVAYETAGQGALWIFIGLEIVLVPVAIRGAFKLLPRVPWGRRMLLAAPETTAPGLPDHGGLVGHEGVTLTELRPTGMARIDDARLSVVAVSGAIPKNERVRVVAVEGAAIRVRPLDAPPPEGDPS